MSDHGGGHEAPAPASSSHNTKWMVGMIILAICFLFAVTSIKSCWTERAEQKEREKERARIERGQRAEEEAKHASVGPALDLKAECITPCQAYVGYSFKVRTDGDPLRIRYHGCEDWFELPAKGEIPSPDCFQPGEALLESPVSENPHIKVWIYEKFWRTR